MGKATDSRGWATAGGKSEDVTSEFQRKLAARARDVGVAIDAGELALFEAYFALLARWNERINLTALTLEDVPNATIDRLFLEPILAARYVPQSPITWFDVGSGGGSPAIPIKIMRPRAALTMVESKERKATFLREVIRALTLSDAQVQNARFERLLEQTLPVADLVTVRAVKADLPLLKLCRRALIVGGKLLLFQSTPEGSVQHAPGLRGSETVGLGNTGTFLNISVAV